MTVAVGTVDVVSMYVGTTPLVALYLGTTPLWPTTAPVTGTVAVTEEADASVIAGTFAPPGVVAGVVLVTEDDDTATVVGAITEPVYTGVVAATEADDTAAVAGTITDPVYTGVIAATEADDTSSIAGTITFVGAIAATEDTDASVIAGTVVEFVGAVAVTELDDAAAVAGTFTAPSFPTIAAINSEVGTSMGAQAINMPTSIVAGNLLIAVAVNDNPAATVMTASAGWTEIRQQVQGANVIRLAAFARIADGTATDNLTITGAAQDYCAWTARITGHAVAGVSAIFVADATAATGNGDPPNLATDSDRGWLWLAAEGVDLTTGNTITAVPSGYTSQFNNVSASSTSSVALAVAARTAAGVSTENPATFTNNPTTRPWVAFTIGIPATAPAAITGTIAVTEADDVAAIAGNDGSPQYVKYRTFNGTSDFATFNIAETASVAYFDPGTAAICLLRTRDSAGGPGGAFQEFLSGCDSGGGLRVAAYFQPSDFGDVFGGSSGAEGTTNSLKSADGWGIMAITKGSTWRDHVYKFSGGGWAHSTMSGPGPSTTSATGAGGFFEVGMQGSLNQWLAAHVAVLAFWHRELSDTECATLHTSLAAWTALSPAHLWRMENTPVTDATGTATQRSITGTTVSGSDSPLPIT